MAVENTALRMLCEEGYDREQAELGIKCEIYAVEEKLNTHSWYTAGYFLFRRSEDKTLDNYLSWVEKA